MEAEVSQSLDAEQQFWTGVDNVVTGPSDTYELIDDALRSYLEFTAEHKKDFLLSEYDVARCCYKLLDAPLFQVNQEYVRRQFLYCLLQVG
ncbi:hypothetical protein KC353_g20207, partial [Hortaea werneckii]